MSNARLKSTIHFVCFIGQRYSLGATQLTKSVVLSDVVSFCNRRKIISGAKIVKAPYGPIPHGYQDALDELEREGSIRVLPPARGYKSTQYEVLTPPGLDGFDAEDTAILEEIVRVVCGKYTAGALSDLTHNEAWEVSDNGEEIPLAAYFPSCVIPSTPEQIQATRKELEAMGYEFS